MVAKNLEQFNVSAEVKELVLKTINQLALNVNCEEISDSLTPIGNLALRVYGPIDWFFNSQQVKKKHKHKITHTAQSFPIPTLQTPNLMTEEELPGNVCAGGAEILAGLLICVLGPVFPVAYGIGGGFVWDGISRIIDGLDELDKSSQSNQTCTGSSNPFEIKF